MGLPELSSNPRDFGLTAISVTGFSPLGDEGNNPQHGTTNVYRLMDNLTWIHGRHQAKFGFDARILQQNAYRDVESRGFISFLGLTGNALAEMLLGFPSYSGGARLDNPQHLRSHSYNFFANDAWRIRPALTLTLGLRYEYNTPAVDAQDRANLYDPSHRTLAPVGTDGMPRGGYLPDRNNFAPRIGLAWMPCGRQNMVVRGYGFYYDQSSLAPGEGAFLASNSRCNPTAFQAVSFQQVVFRGADPLVRAGPPGPACRKLENAGCGTWASRADQGVRPTQTTSRAECSSGDFQSRLTTSFYPKKSTCA